MYGLFIIIRPSLFIVQIIGFFFFTVNLTPDLFLTFYFYLLFSKTILWRVKKNEPTIGTGFFYQQSTAWQAGMRGELLLHHNGEMKERYE